MPRSESLRRSNHYNSDTILFALRSCGRRAIRAMLSVGRRAHAASVDVDGCLHGAR